MIKNLFIVFIFLFSTSVSSQDAIQQWVYNMLERAQIKVDKGDLVGVWKSNGSSF